MPKGSPKYKSFNPKLIAIAGPSASGKTLLAKKLAELIGEDKCLILCQDDYYKDWSHLAREKRKDINFDDIKAFDFTLLAKHVRDLKNGESVQKPCYCFKQSKRLTKRYTLTPKRYIIVEGLMPLFTNRLRKLFDYKIYIDIDKGTGLSRRLKRDTAERGETMNSVCRRYFDEVLPMQERYVEAQKKWADVVVDGRKRITDKEIKNIIAEIASLRSQ